MFEGLVGSGAHALAVNLAYSFAAAGAYMTYLTYGRDSQREDR
jgi:hypothetical protein